MSRREKASEMGRFIAPILSASSVTERQYKVDGVLESCAKIEPTAEKPLQPFFTLIFVKDNPYSPQIGEQNDSKWLSLAMASILGQLLGRKTPTQCEV